MKKYVVIVVGLGMFHSFVTASDEPAVLKRRGALVGEALRRAMNLSEQQIVSPKDNQEKSEQPIDNLNGTKVAATPKMPGFSSVKK